MWKDENGWGRDMLLSMEGKGWASRAAQDSYLIRRLKKKKKPLFMFSQCYLPTWRLGAAEGGGGVEDGTSTMKVAASALLITKTWSHAHNAQGRTGYSGDEYNSMISQSSLYILPNNKGSIQDLCPSHSPPTSLNLTILLRWKISISCFPLNFWFSPRKNTSYGD